MWFLSRQTYVSSMLESACLRGQSQGRPYRSLHGFVLQQCFFDILICGLKYPIKRFAVLRMRKQGCVVVVAFVLEFRLPETTVKTAVILHSDLPGRFKCFDRSA